MKKSYLKQLFEREHFLMRGEKKVCLIETRHRKYISVTDSNSRSALHAEMTALRLMLGARDYSGITRMILLGIGQEKIKKMLPCPSCFEKVSSYFSKKGELLICPLGEYTVPVSITFQAAKKAFLKLGHSKITGMKIEDISHKLMQRTPLRGMDLLFVSQLRLLGISHKIRFFLTGSKSGRSGVASFLVSKNNFASDLDIIAVTQRPRRNVSRSVLNLAASVFPSARGVWKKKTIFLDSGKKRNIVYFVIRGKRNRVFVEMMVEKSVKLGFTRFFNYKKNWYHQIS